MTKPEHKFFERYLDVDLDSLYDFLIKKESEMLEGKFPGITKEAALESLSGHEKDSVTQKLLSQYNIFQLQHPALYDLYVAVRDMAKEACEYYGLDFYKQKYYVQGWVNIENTFDQTSLMPSEEEMKTQAFIDRLHDHSGGRGMPDLHGYFCVFAEPSFTHYQIDRERMFHNKNTNGRAILSETGHPHGRGNWINEEKRRMTIAYDTRTITDGYDNLGDDSDLTQHWIPLV